MQPVAEETSSPFWTRHEFLIRRLHSLTGLVPVGAYMVVHLTVNASILQSPATFQQSVYGIHSLGYLLPLVEWTFIFLPILFHAILGVIIIRGALPNNSTYRYKNNFRYTLQRASGIIAFVFIFWHVFHMHGWFHADWWLENVARPFGGAQFAPYNAASTLGEAMSNWFYPPFYAVGILASVFHLANGIWTMGITWGLWITPQAQRRADWVCLVFGLGLTVVGMSALVGAVGAGTPQAIEQAETVERKLFEAKVESGELDPESELVKHKLKGGHDHEEAPEESNPTSTQAAR
jgi:succinate dehydrogenase / fumarate reductase cytochrome b subunit